MIAFDGTRIGEEAGVHATIVGLAFIGGRIGGIEVTLRIGGKIGGTELMIGDVGTW